MKKQILVIILLAILVVSCLALTACHEHEFGEWTVLLDATCTEDGGKLGTCECGETEVDIIYALGHDEVQHAAKSATCTENGWDAYVTCARCDYTTYAEVAALGHTYGNKACTVCGELVPSSGLKYQSIYDGTSYSYRVDGIGTCTDTEIVIPSTYNGRPVTAIGANAFCENDRITSVIIQSNVTIIDNSAFARCHSLKSVTIGDSVTEICSSAFRNCINLTSIIIPDSVTFISHRAFESCYGLTSVIFEDPEGWYITKEQGGTIVKFVILTDPLKNTTYLTDTYSDYYWYRTN